jgi:hypothetical protein
MQTTSYIPKSIDGDEPVAQTSETVREQEDRSTIAYHFWLACGDGEPRTHTRQRTKPTIYGSHILEKQPMAPQGGSFALANERNNFGNDYDSHRTHSDTLQSRLRDIQMALKPFQKPLEFI